MVVGKEDLDSLGNYNYNPDAPGEPDPALRDQPVPPVPGVHKETRDKHQGNPGSEGGGHTGGGGRDHH